MRRAMISRVADSVYWMSRYIERAENVARFVDVNQYLTLDLQVDEELQWNPMLEVSGDRAAFEAQYGGSDQESVIRFLAFDSQNPNSILSSLRSARDNARSVREVISSEAWRQINKMYHMVRSAADSGKVFEDPHSFLDEVKEGCHQVTGVTEATMSHDEAWHFLRLGRMLERADKTSRLLDVKYFLLLPSMDYVGTPYDKIQWAAVLKSASALEMYRKTYRRIDPKQIGRFLIFDNQFPRSIRFCLEAASISLHAISGSPLSTFDNKAERRLGRLCADIDFSDIEEVSQTGMHQYLDGIQIKLNRVGDAIFETYFSLAPAIVDGALHRGDS
ncbi:MAG: alpha-E domain-containing protein [Nitrospinota bacterium]|nr:alpha-E domain-containing protein [Nitrospinota bacterium]